MINTAPTLIGNIMTNFYDWTEIDNQLNKQDTKIEETRNKRDDLLDALRTLSTAQNGLNDNIARYTTNENVKGHLQEEAQEKSQYLQELNRQTTQLTSKLIGITSRQKAARFFKFIRQFFSKVITQSILTWHKLLNLRKALRDWIGRWRQ